MCRRLGLSPIIPTRGCRFIACCIIYGAFSHTIIPLIIHSGATQLQFQLALQLSRRRPPLNRAINRARARARTDAERRVDFEAQLEKQRREPVCSARDSPLLSLSLSRTCSLSDARSASPALREKSIVAVTMMLSTIYVFLYFQLVYMYSVVNYIVVAKLRWNDYRNCSLITMYKVFRKCRDL